MTIDEAIKHCEEKAAELREYSDVLSETSTTPKGKEISDCLECAEEHEQLAEWLKELKAYREAYPSDSENKFQDLVVFDDQPKRQLEDPDCHNEL